MAQFAYIRVSTQAQSYDRQEYQLKEYFKKNGIDSKDIKIVEEKITSYTSFRERAIYPIIKKSNPGDIIYVCQLDRLGRTVEDIIQLVKFADSLDIELWSIKDGSRITYKTQTGKMMLTLLAMVAEMERELRAERCRAGMEAAKEELKKNGRRISRISGKEQTRFGRPADGIDKNTGKPYWDMSAVSEASGRAKQEAAIMWKEKSQAVKFAHRKRAEGWGIIQIAEELGKLYDEFAAMDGNSNPYSTPTGCKPTKGTVSKWCREMNPLAV